MSAATFDLERKLLPSVLAEIRQKAGLTQAELAAKIGVHRSYISMLESGIRHHPSDAVLYRIAKVCGIPYDELCHRIGRVPNNENAVREWVEQQEDPNRVELIQAILDLDDDSVRALIPVAKRLLREPLPVN